MNVLKLLIVLSVVGVAYHQWNKHDKRGDTAASSAPAERSSNGFIPLPPVAGANPAAILIVAAENCPEEAAQRADRLASQLARDGVPVSRVHSVHFDVPNGDPAIMERLNSVMNSELPIVFVRGRAKSNPTLEEVTAEYKGMRL